MKGSSWIRFDEHGVSKTGKTKIWGVTQAYGTCVLGAIAWYAPWRRYAFTPYPNTVYEQNCLRDIAEFCEMKTKDQRANNVGHRLRTQLAITEKKL